MADENDTINIEVDEADLEDLLILGDDKKLLIEVEYPLEDGSGTVKARAMIKQLTLKEVNKLKLGKNSTLLQQNMAILERALFTVKEEPFPRDKLLILPVGVANAIAEKVLKWSGVDVKEQLRNF